MYKFGFVVLHYKTFMDTIDCVNSLVDLDGNIEIIIVDNYSNNGSIEKVCEKFENYNNVHFIYNNENLGFAKGNNEGIKYGISIGCDFICAINNDTIIKQIDFVEKTIEDWKKKQYSISGPRIISTVDGFEQNPFMVSKHYIKGIKDSVRLFLIGLIKYIFVVLKIPMFWESNKHGFTEGLENQYLLSNKKDFLLNGACLIFSPTYFSEFNKMYDATFMYEEETIIYYLANKLGFLFTYNPDITIYHKEQSSTNYSIKRPRERLLFGYREDLKSRLIVLKLTLEKREKQIQHLK